MASRKRTSFFSDSYTQHTDRRGAPTGTSRTVKNFFGGTTTYTRKNDGSLTVSNNYGRNTYSKKYR